MFPSPSKVDSSPRYPAEHRDEPQPLTPFDVPFSTSQYQSQSNRGSSGASSSSYLASAGPIFNNHELPAPFPNDNHPPHMNSQVLIPRVQRAEAAITPFDTPDPPRYTGGFLAIPNPASPPVPRLRPASWGSPSQMDGISESHRLTRSRSSANFREDSSSEEDLPFGRRTLPPLPIPYEPWRSDLRMASNTSRAPSRDLSPDSGDLSTTNSVVSTSFHTNYSDRGYRSASEQPEASTSTHRLPAIPMSISRTESYPTDSESQPHRSKKPKPRVSRKTVLQGPRRHRDNLPEPGDVGVIECGWTRCNSRIQHDISSVKDHVRFHHGGLFRAKESLICRWVRKDTGEECGSRLLPESLCRHTLDVHTNLIRKDCVCGKRFRKDMLGRHRCEAQGNL